MRQLAFFAIVFAVLTSIGALADGPSVSNLTPGSDTGLYQKYQMTFTLDGVVAAPNWPARSKTVFWRSIPTGRMIPVRLAIPRHPAYPPASAFRSMGCSCLP